MQGSPDVTGHLEVERKFDVEESTLPPSFDGLATAADSVPRLLDAVYFDTATHDLAARGITLRRRTGGSDPGWHLKLPSGPDARTEQQAPLGDDDTVPDILRDMVAAIVRDRRLTPVVRITTARDVTALSGADGAALAEFCDDRVTAGEERWREWEIELVDPGATPGLLDLLSSRLLEAGAVPAAHTSKLARALGASPPQTVHLDPAHRAVADLVEALPVLDRAVRADADDAVHQMRVTLRKIRSLLQVSPGSFGLVDDAAILDELRWLAGLLGAARDAEVLQQRYRRALDRLPTELVRGRVTERLVGGAAQRYREGLRQSLAAMRSARYFRLLDGLDAVVAAPAAGGLDGGAASIEAAYRRLHKAARAAAAGGAGGDDALHRIRKASKRLRYVAAAAGTLLVAERAEAVQTLLGDHQDSVVSRAHLIVEADAARAADEDTFTYDLLCRQEEDLARRSREQLDGALKRLYQVRPRP